MKDVPVLFLLGIVVSICFFVGCVRHPGDNPEDYQEYCIKIRSNKFACVNVKRMEDENQRTVPNGN